MKKNHVKTNIDSLIGEKAKVTEKSTILMRPEPYL